MRSTATVAKFTEDEKQRIIHNPDGVKYLSADGIELYTSGAISRSVLAKLRRAKHLTPIKTGHQKYIYLKSEIDNYLQEQHKQAIINALQESAPNSGAQAIADPQNPDAVIKFLFSPEMTAIIEKIVEQKLAARNAELSGDDQPQAALQEA